MGASNWQEEMANIPSPIMSHNSFSAPSQKQEFSGTVRGLMKTSGLGENRNPGKVPARTTSRSNTMGRDRHSSSLKNHNVSV